MPDAYIVEESAPQATRAPVHDLQAAVGRRLVVTGHYIDATCYCTRADQRTNVKLHFHVDSRLYTKLCPTH